VTNDYRRIHQLSEQFIDFWKRVQAL